MLIYKGIQVFFLGFYIINSYDSSYSLLLKVLSLTLYPSLYEEILFRFIAIGAIKSFNLDDIKTNIIQSLLFGLTHIFTYLLG
ncbi:type II CAAX prenyl endopeptidase Rce1 family protein [Clostridium polynesiense]|uniref:CPBP family glutamic-type intramembrane protease n=1 Tax=Clostridium polynesiense TaxID=1325933 RepID=UPI0009E303AF